MFDFVYDPAMCDRVMSLELRKVTKFAFFIISVKVEQINYRYIMKNSSLPKDGIVLVDDPY